MKNIILFLISFYSLLSAEVLSVQVYKIKDGDTIEFLAQNTIINCRVLGIDTPEKYDSQKMQKEITKFGISYQEMVTAGQMATNYAYQYFNKNKNYEIKITDFDKYKRALCIISDDRGSYNENIVNDGFAVVYKNGKYLKDKAFRHALQVSQGNAVKNNNGLWQDFKTLMKNMAND